MLFNGKLLGTQVGWYCEKIRTNLAIRALKAKKDLQHFPGKGNLTASHITCYAVGNAGDTALSECVRRTFDKKFAVPISWKLQSTYKLVDRNLIRNINSSQILIIGGGGLFLPDTNANLISGWQWACSKEALGEIRVPIVLYSIGYNYFRGQEPSGLFVDNLNAIVGKSDFVGLRNHGSVEAVKGLLQESLRDKICYQPCTTTLIRRIMPELPPKKESGKIAFNFAFDRADKRYGGRQEEILGEIVKSMYILRDRGYDIYVIAHCLNDLSILPMIRDRKRIHAINATAWDLDKLARFYNEMDVVLGMRGHAQMIPFGVNCHIISLGSHEKMRWFLEDIGAEDWYVELTGDTSGLSSRIEEKFYKIHECDGKETTRRIVEGQERLMQVTNDNMRKICVILENARGGVSLPKTKTTILLICSQLSSLRATVTVFSERRRLYAA